MCHCHLRHQVNRELLLDVSLSFSLSEFPVGLDCSGRLTLEISHACSTNKAQRPCILSLDSVFRTATIINNNPLPHPTKTIVLHE